MRETAFQVIVPMTGSGSRFAAAGYKELKPFIDVQGKPMIEWIVSKLFAPEDRFIFVCRKEHLANRPNYLQILKRIAPHCKILEIDEWEKEGPVFDIMKVSGQIDDASPTVVSYCDYFMIWDWQKFKQDVIGRRSDGAVPCYSGFHPHLVPEKNLYASCKVDEREDLLEIREKFSFEDDKSRARHSPGLYYFKSGSLLKKYYQKAIQSDLKLNGEFYSSLPYNLLVADGLKVWAPVNVDFFCQWGTPEDLEEYLFWSKIVKGFVK